MFHNNTKERIFSAILKLAESLGGEASIRYMRESERCEIYAEPQITRELMRDVLTALLPAAHQRKTCRITFDLKECSETHIEQLEHAATVLHGSEARALFAKELKQAMQALYRKLGGYGEEVNLALDQEGFRVSLSAGSGQMLMLANILKGFVGAEYTDIVQLRQGISTEEGFRNQVAVDLDYFANPERMVALHQLVGNYRANTGRSRDMAGFVSVLMLGVVLLNPFTHKHHTYNDAFLTERMAKSIARQQRCGVTT